MTKNKKINNSILVDGKTDFRKDKILFNSFKLEIFFAKIENDFCLE